MALLCKCVEVISGFVFFSDRLSPGIKRLTIFMTCSQNREHRATIITATVTSFKSAERYVVYENHLIAIIGKFSIDISEAVKEQNNYSSAIYPFDHLYVPDGYFSISPSPCSSDSGSK